MTSDWNQLVLQFVSLTMVGLPLILGVAWASYRTPDAIDEKRERSRERSLNSEKLTRFHPMNKKKATARSVPKAITQNTISNRS